MARTSPDTFGPWPEPLPLSGAPTAVWLDGTTGSAAIAHWLTGAGARVTALVDADAPAPARAAALATAGRLGLVVTPVSPEGPVTDVVGWAKAGRAARDSGARHLVLPSRADNAEPPLPLRLHAAETALRAGGLEALWAPLVGWAPTDTFRLALALGVPFEHTWDCRHDDACGQCEGCSGRVRALKQLGMPDPLA